MNNLGTWKSNHRRYFPTRLLRILVVASEAIIIGKNAIRIGKKNARDLFETRSVQLAVGQNRKEEDMPPFLVFCWFLQ